MLRIAQSYHHFGRLEEAVRVYIELMNDKRFAAADEVAEATFLPGDAYKMQRKFDDALAALGGEVAGDDGGAALHGKEVVVTDNISARWPFLRRIE